MASGTIRINTDDVRAIASEIERINGQLKDQLLHSKKQIDSLGNTWTGKAAQDTREAFNGFSNKYFQMYYDIIAQYVAFLRRNVSEGYDQTEASNASLSEAFK